MLSTYHADYVMADPSKLRKCEELLGTLSENPPARDRNPMWVLLKGIEGFNTERASECLLKLLDKHYDTIGVLKLASKRDLVEDAGILPGDALRIVAAAKHYVAPQDADHSHEPTPQRDVIKAGGVRIPSEAHQVQGVEHLVHAYIPTALREKTGIFTPLATSHASTHAYFPPVMQEQGAVPTEGVKESKVEVESYSYKLIHDALRVKNSKIPAQTYPIPVGITYPHTCGICKVKCISEINCRMHYNGRTHKTKFANVLEAVEEAKRAAETQELALKAKQPTQSIPVVSLHACGVCNVKCNSAVNIRSHFNGRKHAQTMELATDSNDNTFTRFLHCSICNVNANCKRNLVMHFNGQKHAENMKVDSDSGDCSYYSNSESYCSS